MDHGLDRFDLGVHCDRLGRLTRRGMYATSVVARIGAEAVDSSMAVEKVLLLSDR